MTQQTAMIIGICLQLLGSAWLVWAARSTVKKLQHFQVSLTYGRMGDAVGSEPVRDLGPARCGGMLHERPPSAPDEVMDCTRLWGVVGA